ncbi:uncharacterized protein BCR38DRAFT_448445, partial [Pseudomassariella vexata]
MRHLAGGVIRKKKRLQYGGSLRIQAGEDLQSQKLVNGELDNKSRWSRSRTRRPEILQQRC